MRRLQVALRSAYLAGLPAGLRKFEMFIGKREFFAGSSVSLNLKLLLLLLLMVLRSLPCLLLHI